jgi:SAM-dependent methyltransferase
VSLPPAYFDDLYAKSLDPWGLAERAYEGRKYAMTLAALPNTHYERAFEPGCSIGVLSRLLSPRVERLVASDASVVALEVARRYGQPENVEFIHATVPEEWPDGVFDLIVFSELGYYFDPADLDRFMERARDSLKPVGHLIAVHWRPVVLEYPSNAQEVHSRLQESSAFVPLAHYEDPHFLLDVFGATKSARLIGPED